MPITFPASTYALFGQSGATWGTNESNQNWSGDTESFYTRGNDTLGAGPYGKVAVSASTFPTYDVTSIDLDNYGIGKQPAAEVLALVKWGSQANPLNPATDGGPVLNKSSANTFYFASIQDSTNEVVVAAYVGGTYYEMKRVGRTLTPDTWYWVRFRIDTNDGHLKLKVWNAITHEPTSWLISVRPDVIPYIIGPGDWGWISRRTVDNYTWYLRSFYGHTQISDETIYTTPVVDSFTRDVREGFGITPNYQPWLGNVALDPDLDILTGTAIAANTYASITTSDDVDRVGMLGPVRSGDSDTLAKINFNSTAGTTHAYIGVRGIITTVSRAIQYKGYAVKVTSGGTLLSLWKSTAFGGGWTTLGGSVTAHTALTSSDAYWVRIQVIGTTVRARIWKDGNAEPVTWNISVTDSSITAAGGGFFVVNQTTGTTSTRTVRFYSWTHGAPTYTGTLFTAQGGLTLQATTDTTLTLRQAFTNDTNANNTIAILYKATTAATYTTYVGSTTRTGSYYEFTLTGLHAGTTYVVNTTISDADGVTGTIPTVASFTTSEDAVTATTIEITGTSPTSIDVRAHYTDDPNTNSTASLAYRVSGANVNIIDDEFNGPTGAFLQNHLPEVGGAWTRHPLSAVRNVVLYQGRIYSATILADEKVLYYSATTPLSAEYDVKAQFYVAQLHFDVGIAGRMSTTNGNYYYVKYNVTTLEWQLVRANNGGADVLLASFQQSLVQGNAYDVMLRIRDAYKSVYVDGVEILRSTDNTHTSTGVAGIYFKAPTSDLPPEGGFIEAEDFDFVGTPTNQLLLDEFVVDYRVSGGSYTVVGAMTANRSDFDFFGTASSLTSDTVYELRVTFSDANGVNGINPLYITAQTNGQTVQLDNIIVSPQATSAIVEVVYLYDTNNNSDVEIQYRNVRDLLWTTVSSNKIITDRGSKRFFTTIVALKPSSTYQVKAIISDPNGLVDGSDPSRTELFATNGITFEDQLQSKNFLWKVYDALGEYITTWHDAPDPEYTWQENGGVSDLKVTLNRPLSTLQTSESGIDFQHRVDVWTLDPSSDGFGPNLVLDPDFSLGSWTLGSNATVSTSGGPDDGSALNIDATSSSTTQTTRSEFIPLFRDNEFDNTPLNVPFVLQSVVKARGGKITMYLQAYGVDETLIDTSDQIIDSVGTEWQTLRIEYRPPTGTYYLRVAFENTGAGFFYADKVELRPKEQLVYRGRIESFTPKIDQDGESVDVEVLGLISLLSDDYIDFLQYVQVQPESDALEHRVNYGKEDPANMLKKIILMARKQNPEFVLYFSATSIQPTNIAQGYTFREQQVRACFDKIRDLCPSGWHYYVEPDGCVNLRGPETAPVHKLRVGVEVMNFSVEKSIRNLKNYIHVKGRQDSDNSELDGEGSISYIAFDQDSIDKYGKRVLFLRNAQITDHATAELVGEGRLDEYNREEQRAQCLVPDEKSITYSGGALRGYNIESFRPGDNVILFDPVAGPRSTYWDQFKWDDENTGWNAHYVFSSLPSMVPIKSIQLSATEARLELSERQPSGTGDFGRLLRYLQLNDADSVNEN